MEKRPWKGMTKATSEKSSFSANLKSYVEVSYYKLLIAEYLQYLVFAVVLTLDDMKNEKKCEKNDIW